MNAYRLTIGTKHYDTRTAHYVGTWGNVVTDTYSLYRKRTGEYFLLADNGEGDATIQPLDYEQARDLAAKNLDSDAYEEEFGDGGSEVGSKLVGVRVPSETAKSFARLAAIRGIGKGQLMTELVRLGWDAFNKNPENRA